MYERTVRQLTGHNDFALPYWDWTADRQLPAAFTQPTWNGQPNPLYESQRSMSPTDSLPDEIVGQGVIATIPGRRGEVNGDFGLMVWFGLAGFWTT